MKVLDKRHSHSHSPSIVMQPDKHWIGEADRRGSAGWFVNEL